MDTSKGGGLRIFITGPDGQVKAQASGGDRHLLWVRRAEEEMVSAPAHCGYKTRLLKIADAAKKPLGDAATSNKRVINQFIHPDVLKTCQLSMGMTVLESGSVWNTMPAHTHERRMEV